MGHSDIVDYARNFAVMVRIRGPVSFSVSLSGSGQTQCCIIMVTQLAISVTLLSGPKRDEDEKTRFSSIPVRRPIHYLILFVSQSFFFFFALTAVGVFSSPSGYVYCVVLARQLFQLQGCLYLIPFVTLK